MSCPEISQLYKENSILQDIDALDKLKKKFQFFEKKNLIIQSKWISHYEATKIQNEKKKKNALKLDIGPRKEKNFMDINKEYFADLPDTDPIKIWYKEDNDSDIKNLEDQMSRQIEQDIKSKSNIERNFLKSKVSENDVFAEKNLPSPLLKKKNANMLFKALLENKKKKNEKNLLQNQTYEIEEFQSRRSDMKRFT